MGTFQDAQGKLTHSPWSDPAGKLLWLSLLHERMKKTRSKCRCRLRAKKGPAPPLGNFADISYLKEKFKPHILRDVCTLCSGALVSDSLLHMLL